MNIYYVYILASHSNDPVLYIGVTNNIERRLIEHRSKLDGFTSDYSCDKLVYFEETSDIKSAISREKQLKNWHRDWKINLISKTNPDWVDLYKQETLKQVQGDKKATA